MKFAVLTSALSETSSVLNGLEKSRNPKVFDPHPHNTYDLVALDKATAVEQLVEMINSKQYDAFLNLCEGSWFDGRAGEEVVRTLQRLNAPFTGCRLPFYSISKQAMKMAAHSCGVAVPDHIFVYDESDLEAMKKKAWAYPLLVKHHDGHDSIGLSKESKVDNMQDLLKQTELVMKQYGGALVEQFIKGPEYTVLVVVETDDFRPYVYNPLECDFGNPSDENFKDFDSKWRNHEKISWKDVQDEKLREELKTATLKIFDACEGTGYARCDFRLDIKTNKLYFLEINTNCSVFYTTKEEYGSADEILSRETRGHPMFLRRILRNALKYRDMAKKSVKVRFDNQKGFHIVAGKDLKTGDVVFVEENKATRMVSKQYMKTCDPTRKDLIKKYGYKITENVYGSWSEESDQWHPLNHSCDPNTWLSGLNLEAKKDIKEGEEITLDYATFTVLEEGFKFECNCGAEKCRKIVNPDQDCLNEDFAEKYGDHVSDFVKSYMKNKKNVLGAKMNHAKTNGHA